MSGSSLAPWSLANNPTRYARQLAREVNCSHTPLGDELKKCLRTKSLHVIMQAQVEVSGSNWSSGEGVLFFSLSLSLSLSLSFFLSFSLLDSRYYVLQGLIIFLHF